MKRTWIAMFSHTGTEIARLAKKLGRVPDRVITNQDVGNYSDEFKSMLVGDVVNCAKTPTAADYQRLFSRGHPVITLHGWMRIVPDDVCEYNEIYNLHPGLVTKYPSLVGKDPQSRAWKEKHKYAGCVLHRCTSELDGGPIIAKKWFHNKYDEYKDFDNRLREVSIELWTKTLTSLLT